MAQPDQNTETYLETGTPLNMSVFGAWLGRYYDNETWRLGDNVRGRLDRFDIIGEKILFEVNKLISELE